MLDVFLTTVPVYLMILLGFAAVRVGYFDGGHIAALGQFVLKIALPALIISAIGFPRGDAALNAAFLGAYTLGSVAALVVGFAAMRLILRRTAPESWILGMGMATSNSGFIGFPIASLFFGPEAAVVFAMTILIENVVVLPLATIAASATGKDGARVVDLVRKALVALVRNPFILAVGLALVIRALHLPVPEVVQHPLRLLASVASPVALFVVGGTVARMSVSGHWRRAGSVMLGKLVLHPLMVAVMLLLVPGVPPALIPVGIVFAAMPMVTIYPLLAAPFGLGAVTSTALLISTALSCLTVSIALHLLIGV